MKLKPGDRAPDFSAETAHHGGLELSDFANDTLLLQFYRFAGCPVCNLSLRTYAKRHADLAGAGIWVVAVFHSGAASLREHVRVKVLPFPLLADPDKTIYQRYGVESSVAAMRSPKVIGKALRAVSLGYLPGKVEGGGNGLPADFLIEQGVVRHAHYGTHAADTLSVDEALKLL